MGDKEDANQRVAKPANFDVLVKLQKDQPGQEMQFFGTGDIATKAAESFAKAYADRKAKEEVARNTELCTDHYHYLELEEGTFVVPWPVHCAVRVLIALVATVAVDVIVCRTIAKGDFEMRQSLLRALIGTAIMVTSVPDLIDVFADPICAIAQVAASYWPIYLSMSLGIYIALTSDLDRTAKLDHLFFVAVNAAVVFSYWGAIFLIPVFCVSGLPAIDEWLLVLSKKGYTTRDTEKRVNTNITLWVRTPGLVAAATIAWVCLMHNTTKRLPIPLVLVYIIGCIANAALGGKRNISVYHVFQEQVTPKESTKDEEKQLLSHGDASE